MKKYILIALGLFVTMLLVLAVIDSIMTSRSLDECFFEVCCGLIYVVGLAFGFTYKQICVIVNIYLEAGLCLLSALWVTWTSIKRFVHEKTGCNGIIMTSGIMYGLAYLVGFYLICQHYAMPMENAFDLCYRELLHLAKCYHTTYNIVNYVIFILLFLVITVLNIILVKLIGKKREMQ